MEGLFMHGIKVLLFLLFSIVLANPTQNPPTPDKEYSTLNNIEEATYDLQNIIHGLIDDTDNIPAASNSTTPNVATKKNDTPTETAQKPQTPNTYSTDSMNEILVKIEKIIDTTNNDVENLTFKLKKEIKEINALIFKNHKVVAIEKSKTFYKQTLQSYKQLLSQEQQINNSLSASSQLIATSQDVSNRDLLNALEFKNDEIQKDLSVIKVHLNELSSKIKLSTINQ